MIPPSSLLGGEKIKGLGETGILFYEVLQLIYEVPQLIYEVPQLLYEVPQLIGRRT